MCHVATCLQIYGIMSQSILSGVQFVMEPVNIWQQRDPLAARGPSSSNGAF